MTEFISLLKASTGFSLSMCRDAIVFATTYSLDISGCDSTDLDVALAYLKAKTLAVATVGLTFNERVKHFYEKDAFIALRNLIELQKEVD